MRVANRYLIVSMVCMFLMSGSWSEAGGLAGQVLSGRVVFQAGSGCGSCQIRVELSGARPMASTFADANGNFLFVGVRPGSYLLRVNIDGQEEAEHPVEVYENMMQSNVSIPIMRRIVMKREPSSGGVVDVSQFMDRYPKKAVDRYKRASESRKRNQRKDAIKWLEDAIEIAPDFYHAYNDLGLLYRDAGRFEDAERAFLKAHEINQSSADPLINLTSLYIDENQPEKAVPVAEQAIKKNERSAPAFFNLGLALYKISMLDRAETALKKALHLAPKMFQVRLVLANVYAKLRRYDNVIEQLDTYLEENPDGEHRKEVEDMRQKLLQPRKELR